MIGYHFALEAQPSLGEQMWNIAKPYVAFEEGCELLVRYSKAEDAYVNPTYCCYKKYLEDHPEI
jgi:hypothetical protein